MEEKDYTESDKAVLGCVATAVGLGGTDQSYVMGAIEKFGVRAEWFRDNRHQVFFKAVEKIWKEHRVLDIYMITKECDIPGAGAAIQELLEYPAVMAHLDYYLKCLKQRFIYGTMHRMMSEQLREMSPDNIGVQVEDFVKKVHDLQEKLADNDNGLRQIGDFMERSIAIKEKLHEERFVKHNWAYLDGLAFPWHCVNQIFAGLKPGLHIIAALASQGKSTLAVDLSVFWNQTGVKHGFVSIDMAAAQLVDRYSCVSEMVSLAKLNFGASKKEVERFADGYRKHAKLNNVWFSEADDAKTIEYQCYRGVKTLGWKAIIIDYIQLVSPDEKGQMPEYTRVQRAVQAVKRVAKRLEVPIVCLAQLSRAFEAQLREGKGEPGLDAIGDSAEIARAAASVTCLYQDQQVRTYWQSFPPVKLGFADPEDRAWKYDIVNRVLEMDEDTEARRKGQMSLAKAVRPVWFDVLKNQQGRTGKLPFVMFSNYFLFRPGNDEGVDREVTMAGKERKLPLGKFEQICDDWVYAEQDWWLEMTGAMPRRGCKLMGETYDQMNERMQSERQAHPEVKHFVPTRWDEEGDVEWGEVIEAKEVKG